MFGISLLFDLAKNIFFHFLYVVNLIKKGKSVEEKDISIQIRNFHEEFENFFSRLRRNQNRFVKTVVQFYWKKVVLFALPAAISDFVFMIRPYFMYQVIALYSDRLQNTTRLITFVFVLFFVEICGGFMHEIWQTEMRKFKDRVTMLIKCSVYRKSLLVLDIKDKGEVNNLQGSDSWRACEPFNHVYELPCKVFVRLGISFIYLIVFLKFAAIFPILVLFLILVPINYFCIRYCDKNDKKQNKLYDERVGLIKQILANIVTIKSFFWENFYFNKVESVRNKFLKLLISSCISWSIVELLFICNTFFLTGISLVTYSRMGNELTVPIVFSVTSVISLVVHPIFMISYTFNSIAKSRNSFKRIEEFLNLDELDEREESVDDPHVVSMKNASFSWKVVPDKTDDEKKVEVETKEIISDVSLSVEKGEFVIISGVVGSGKTSLLLGILNEINVSGGTSHVNTSKISYYSQNQWLQNETVKNNILFGSKFDEVHYTQVLRDCDLVTDLDSFPKSDDSFVGDRGITLSGGQKARVQIGRCIYPIENELFIFDDCFKDLDVRVASNVFNRVFLDRLKGKTRILVTHQRQFFKFADRIIVMDEGKISREYSRGEEIPEIDDRRIQNDDDSGKSDRVVEEIVDHSEDSEDEELSSEFNWKLIIEYFRVYRKTFIFCVTLVFLYPILELLRDMVVIRWVEKDETSSSTTYMILYLGIGFSASAMVVFTQILFNCLCVMIAKYYHSKLTDSLLKATCSWINNTPAGKVLTRFGEDISCCDHDVRWRSRELLFCGSMFVISLLFAFYWYPVYLVFCVPLLVFVVVLVKRYVATFVKFSRIRKSWGSKVSSLLNETIDGLNVIRTFKKQEDFVMMNSKIIETCLNVYGTECDIDRLICITTTIVTNLLILLFSMIAIFSTSIHPGIFGLVFSTLWMRACEIGWLVWLVPGIQRSFISVERIVKYCNCPKEEYEGIKMDGIDGGIEFKNVSFAYPPRGSSNKNEKKLGDSDYVLKNISFKFEENMTYGIVGRTGSGKSSIIRLMIRLYDIQKGVVCVGGNDIKNLSLEFLRTNIAYISQNPCLFVGSVRSNLDPREEFSDSEIWNTLEQVNMKKKVSELKNSIQTDVSDVKLSSGEKQLLSFARILLNPRKVLILDESTAALDSKTDDLCQKIVQNNFHRKSTNIIIAHRLKTVLECDKILVLDDGRVVEFDETKNLLRDEKSTFFQLVKKSGVDYQRS